MAWAIKMRSENRTDGKREFLMGLGYVGRSAPNVGPMSGYKIAVFATREAARKYINSRFSHYKRPDLKKEPHGWKMPIPVKVKVNIIECTTQPQEGE